MAPTTPKQPLDGPDGCRTRQHGSSGLKSTTGASRGGSFQHETDHNAWGGPYNDFQVRDPIHPPPAGAPGSTFTAQLTA